MALEEEQVPPSTNVNELIADRPKVEGLPQPLDARDAHIILSDIHVSCGTALQCPPTKSNFAPILEEYGTSVTAKEILSGDCDLKSLNLSPEMKWFLESLKMNEKEKKMEIPKRMSQKDFQKVMKLQDETTTTTSSPSGIHYTLWKALAEDDDLAELHSLWLSMPLM
eukprot:scaffold82298_cov45-Cyclotella_meneghiniana.AAC.7